MQGAGRRSPWATVLAVALLAGCSAPGAPSAVGATSPGAVPATAPPASGPAAAPADGLAARVQAVLEGRPTPGAGGDVTLVRGTRSVLVGVGAVAHPELARWAAAADQAVRAVRRAITGGWHRPVTVVLVGARSDLEELTGRPAGAWQHLAGLTLAEAGDRGAYRIYLNGPLLAGSTWQARDIVLRHEITHVASGAPATATTPTWLEEGLAQYLGYLGSGVPLGVATQDVADVPRRLPADDAFTGPDAQAAYELAHLVCVAMVEQVGLRGLLEVYRRTAASGDFAAAWRAVSGTGTPALLARWRELARTVPRA